MTAALRPMNLGEILDRTFEIYRKQFWGFVRISIVPALAMMLVRFANEFWWKIKPPDLAHLFNVLNLGTLLFLLVFFHLRNLAGSLIYTSIARLTSTECLTEQPAPSSSARLRLKRWKTNCALALYQIGIVLVIPEIAAVALMLGAAALEQWLGLETSLAGWVFTPTVLFFIAAGIAGYFWMCGCFSLGWPSVPGENLTAWQAMRRGWLLSRKSRSRIVVARLVPITLWWVFNITIGFAAELVFFGIRHHRLSYSSRLIIYVSLIALTQWIADTLVGPIFPIALTLFYYDQRVRREAFDLEKMMEAAGLSTPAPGEDEEKSSEAQETAPESI
jgi:hypothetical protein